MDAKVKTAYEKIAPYSAKKRRIRYRWVTVERGDCQSGYRLEILSKCSHWTDGGFFSIHAFFDGPNLPPSDYTREKLRVHAKLCRECTYTLPVKH